MLLDERVKNEARKDGTESKEVHVKELNKENNAQNVQAKKLKKEASIKSDLLDVSSEEDEEEKKVSLVEKRRRAKTHAVKILFTIT